MPYTPGPGGVDDEHMYTPRFGVAYGTGANVGRNSRGNPSLRPPPISPPTLLRLRADSSAGVVTARARTTSRKPGANLSSWSSMASVRSPVQPFGTCPYTHNT